MADNHESTMKWKVDIAQLKAGMQEAKRSISLANAEFKSATAGMGKWQQSITGVEAKLKQLNSVADAQDAVLEELNQQYEIVAREMGETSPEAQKLQIQIKNQEAVCKKTRAEIANYNDQLDKLKSEQVDTRNAAEKLTDTINDQESELKDLKQAYSAAVLEYGKNSTEAKNLANQIKDLSSELKENKDKMKDADKAADDLDESLDDVENSAKDAEGGFSVLKGALANLASQGISFVIDKVKDMASAMVDATKDAADFADNIATLSSTTGIDTDSLQEMSYMADLVDVSLETVTGSMTKLVKNMDSAKSGTGAAADAFKTLGVDVMDGNKHLRNSQDVFNEVINALGGIENETERDALAMQIFGKSARDLNPMIEAGSDALEDLRNEAHDVGYVLGEESLENLNELQNSMDRMTGATEAMKRQFAANIAPIATEIMTPLIEVIKDLPSAVANGDFSGIASTISGVINDVLGLAAQLIPSMVNLVNELLVQLILVVNQNLPQFIALIPSTISQLLVAISSALPIILQSVLAMIPELCSQLLAQAPVLFAAFFQLLGSIVEAIPLVIEQVLAMLPSLIQSLTEFFGSAIPQITQAAIALLMGILDALPVILSSLETNLPLIIDSIISFFTDNIDTVLECSIQLLMAIIDAIPVIIQLLVVNLPQIIVTIANALIQNIPKIIQAAVRLFAGIVEAIPQVLGKITSAAGSIVSSIAQSISNGFSQMLSVGRNLVSGIWQGISNSLSWLKDRIRGWVGNVTSFLKNLFKIGSPSKLMRDEIGRWLPRGIAVGFDQTMPEAERDMQSAIDAALGSLKTDVALSTANIVNPSVLNDAVGGLAPSGGSNIVFNQYNNSPKALDRLSIYRQTNSLLFTAKVGLSNV